jgi:pimeloyl-ACP methyl ester carboxylesterase
MRRWRGLKKLIHDAVDHTTDVVEDAHDLVARTTLGYLEQVGPLAGPARAVDTVRRLATTPVFAAIHGVNRVVEVLGDGGLDVAERLSPGAAAEGGPTPPPPMSSSAMGSLPWVGDAALGMVNGVIGDYLHERGNGLDLGMSLRLGDRYLPAEGDELRRALAAHPVSSKLALFVHGLSCTEWSWCLKSEEHHGDPAICYGSLLERDLGYTPIYVRYNTGRHISENGRELSEQLERLVAAWPCELASVALVGHSMGGLVSRSACHLAREGGRRWIERLTHVISLGSPHRGAPLEKLGNVLTSVLRVFEVPGTQIPARLIDARSAGIKDLRYGYVVDEEWQGADPDALLEDNRREVPLLDGVTYAFIASTVTERSDHPVGVLVGDLLVRVPSATGPAVSLGTFPIRSLCFGGLSHLEIQNHPDVYEQVRRIVAGEAAAG